MSFKSNTGTIIDRAINELRTGRPLIIQNNKEYWMFFNIEHSQSKIFNQFNKHLIDEKYLLITKQKAQSIFNKNIKSNIYFEINPKTDVNQIINLFVNPLSNNKVIKFTNIKKFKAKNFHNVCIDLSKNAKMIPSLVFKKINKKYYKNINEFGFKNGILIFDYKDLLKQNELICESIKLVSSAKVPLPKNENSNFKGEINKNKNILETSKIEISNKNNRILIKGEYNYSNNFIDIILNLSQNNEIYLTTLIKGNLNNPNISFDENSKFFQNSNSNENNIIEESVIQFLNNFFDFND